MSLTPEPLMTSETLVQIQNNLTEKFFMSPSTKIAQMFLLCQKRGCQISRYLQTTYAPEPLVQIQNHFTEMFMLPSTKIDQNVQLG